MMIAADFEMLWDDHRHNLIRYMRHRLPYSDAEDLVQEVYLSAWQAMCSGKGYTDNARGWLYRIAHNLVIDQYRARTRHPELVELDDVPESKDYDGGSASHKSEVLVAQDEPVEGQVEHSLVLEEVGRAIDLLVEEQRVVVLRYLQGYEYKEIGKELGKHHEAVKARHYRAIAVLRDRIARWNAPSVPLKQRFYQRSTPLNKPPRKHRKRVSHVADAVQRLLLERGPMMPLEMTKYVQFRKASLARELKKSDTFVIIGQKNYKGKTGYVWGVRGVHDIQEAA